MTIIESTKDGRPQYRVRWNYRRVGGKQTYDEKRFNSKSEAHSYHRTVTAGHTTTTETITVSELADIWIFRHVETDACQLRTQKDYQTHLRLRIRPYLGSKRVANLTPKVLAEWRTWMLESQATGGRTVNKSIDALKSMIRWGRSEGLCMNTMVDDLRRVKAQRPKEANPYTPEQVQTIVEGCKYLREATLINLAAYSGLRWSELRALQWSDIDLKAGTIRLVRSLDLDNSAKATKSNTERLVPILQPGVLALRKWRKHAPTNVPLVFASRTGGPVKHGVWYNFWLPEIREACKIDFDLHELRDTYASILIQSGIGEAELTLWLGHRSIQTTLNRYGKLFESRKLHLVGLANANLASL